MYKINTVPARGEGKGARRENDITMLVHLRPRQPTQVMMRGTTRMRRMQGSQICSATLANKARLLPVRSILYILVAGRLYL